MPNFENLLLLTHARTSEPYASGLLVGLSGPDEELGIDRFRKNVQPSAIPANHTTLSSVDYYGW